MNPTPLFSRRSISIRSMAVAALLAGTALITTAHAATPAEMLAGYTSQAGAPASAARGQQFFNRTHGKEWNCGSCHGAPPADPRHRSVAALTECIVCHDQTVTAAGGINAAVNPADDWRSHAYDTVKGSDFLGDQDAIEIMCREAPAEVMHLEHIGVTFHRNETGNLDLRAFGGASMKRTAYVADITGQAILHVLYEQLMKYHQLVDRYEEWFVTSIVLDEQGHCVGVVAREIRSGRTETFSAKNVILASGGAGQCFKPTTNALICTGDGIAQAYKAGAPLMDMEMIQYHPTTLAENGFLITEGARGEGAHLLNSEGERFMEKYAPNKMELASRDVVSRAEQTEINEGRGVGPDGQGIWLDITVVPRKRTLEALREIVNIGKDFAGVDITREPIRIKPGNHYTMGGSRPTSGAAPTSTASTPPARSRASRSTAATASVPTPFSTP